MGQGTDRDFCIRKTIAFIGISLSLAGGLLFTKRGGTMWCALPIKAIDNKEFIEYLFPQADLSHPEWKQSNTGIESCRI